jgi:uncharacterized membrane protein YphA (DoxX/SURF4 family)
MGSQEATTMKTRLTHAARILLGLVFFVFGLNGFLHFIPQPPMSGPPLDFVTALVKSGYEFDLLKGTEVAAGVLLLSGRFVPLALAVLAPIIVNILAFHAFLAPAGLGVPVVVLGLELYLAWSYRSVYRPMLGANVQPDPTTDGTELSRHALASR